MQCRASALLEDPTGTVGRDTKVSCTSYSGHPRDAHLALLLEALNPLSLEAEMNTSSTWSTTLLRDGAVLRSAR